jgi:type IV secretion system protein VirB6
VLANPASAASVAVTALVTLFVALIGVRMLMGRMPDVGDIVTGGIKIGLVLLIASSWAAYRVVAYDVILKGPAEIATQIGGAAGLPGGSGDLVDRLQTVDDGVVALMLSGTGRLDVAAASLAGSPPTPRTPLGDDLALGLARIAYLAGTIGALGLVRLSGGVLLALAPLFAGLLLFEATRGFFVGWVSMLVATALGALGATLILGVQLGLLEPWLAGVLAMRAERLATPAAPLELLVMMLGFAVILSGLIALTIRLCLTAVQPARWGGWAGSTSAEAMRAPNHAGPIALRPGTEPEGLRARAIAENLGAARWRGGADARADRSETPASGSPSRVPAGLSTPTGATPVPLGLSYRRTASRVPGVAPVRRRSA